MLTTSQPQTATSKVSPEKWQRVLSLLTPLLRKGALALRTIDEQVLYVLSMISSCSALFTRMQGVYHRDRVFSNLFLIVMAPPASGKGAMAGSRVALGKIHQELLQRSRTMQAAYKEQLALSLKSKTAPPEKPPFTVLFLPGNCTSSKMIQHIKDNGNNPLLIHETEASTMASANKSQYGDFSDLVRKSFQSEAISYTRKFNDEFVEVDQPKLAIVISGTPDQIIQLIGTPEDGTFSRYMFFSFEGQDEWQDANCKDCESFTDLMKSQQDEFYQLYHFFSDRDVTFNLTDQQWEQFNSLFRRELESVAASGNVYAKGVVKRHGVMFYKMLMVLSALRSFHLNSTDNLIECEDKDFEVAKELISISLESSLEVLELLPTPKGPIKQNDKKGEFFSRLKEQFNRAEAVELGQTFKVTSRTVDRWLEGLVAEGRLSTERQGHYIKNL